VLVKKWQKKTLGSVGLAETHVKKNCPSWKKNAFLTSYPQSMQVFKK
jgi:hypothetical protein